LTENLGEDGGQEDPQPDTPLFPSCKPCSPSPTTGRLPGNCYTASLKSIKLPRNWKYFGNHYKLPGNEQSFLNIIMHTAFQQQENFLSSIALFLRN
jgi:hypothetical protein